MRFRLSIAILSLLALAGCATLDPAANDPATPPSMQYPREGNR